MVAGTLVLTGLPNRYEGRVSITWPMEYGLDWVQLPEVHVHDEGSERIGLGGVALPPRKDERWHVKGPPQLRRSMMRRSVSGA